MKMQGCNFGCPSVSKSIVYGFGKKFTEKMTIGVLGVENKSANVQVTLPTGYEVRKRTPGPVGNEAVDEGLIAYKLAAIGNDQLDIVETGRDIPVATIEVIDVHPKGEVIRKSPFGDVLADEDYIYANVLHPVIC